MDTHYRTSCVPLISLNPQAFQFQKNIEEHIASQTCFLSSTVGTVSQRKEQMSEGRPSVTNASPGKEKNRGYLAETST
jgi:hypothetical protein